MLTYDIIFVLGLSSSNETTRRYTYISWVNQGKPHVVVEP